LKNNCAKKRILFIK